MDTWNEHQDDGNDNIDEMYEILYAKETVEQVLAMLQEFYEKTGSATALGQQHPTPPPTWEEAYTGMQSRSGGVIEMLQGILTDLIKTSCRYRGSRRSRSKCV